MHQRNYKNLKDINTLKQMLYCKGTNLNFLIPKSWQTNGVHH